LQPEVTNAMHLRSCLPVLALHTCLQVIATGQLVHIHPSSVLLQRKPECVVFNELVRTTKHYARVLTSIDLRWLPELCPAFFAAKAGAGAG
jgi:ATP-dependent RNA helicase DHX8/PRP22